MPIQTPQWSEYLSCTVCCNEFDTKTRRPISLACGHTMCQTCLRGLSCKQCPFDQTSINCDIDVLPENYALLLLTPKFNSNADHHKSVKYAALDIKDGDVNACKQSHKYIEDLAPFLKPSASGHSDVSTSMLSRPMQRKLIALVNCQLVETEGRSRALRAARSLGERVVTELILQHQNPQQLCTNLWAAVRSRGCQFLGPAMQEEVLKLILLALEEGCSLSRKVLVMFVVQRLEPHFPQASKTSIGHVVQLLYRASCFKVLKRDKDSSLMMLKDEFRTYESLRREHDAQIVQIATEAGLRIAPDQWSSLLYADTAHKSHMQSIMDKLQTPQSFAQSVQELMIALQRTADPGNLSNLQSDLDLLAAIDSTSENLVPSWNDTQSAMQAIKNVVQGMVSFMKSHSNRKLYDHSQAVYNKFKTSMCRDYSQKRVCPRGANCNFAHSLEEMERYRSKNKKANVAKHPVGPNASAAAENLPKKSSNGSCDHSKDDETENISEQMAKVSIHNVQETRSSSSESSDVMPTMNKNGSAAPNTAMTWTTTASNSYEDGQVLSSNIPSGESRHMPPAQPSNRVLFQPYAPPAGQSQATLIALAPQAPQMPHVQAIPAVFPASFHPNIQQAQIVATGPGQPVALAPAPPGTPVEETISVISPSCFDPNAGYQLWQGGGYRGSIYHVMNVESIQPDIISSPAEKLAYLEKRKMDLLSHMDSQNYPKISKDSNVDNTNTKPVYSPWTSKSFAEPLKHVSSSCSTTPSSMSLESQHQRKYHTTRSDNRNEEFASSDDDQFIPFDPPLVSRFGPISRMARSLIRGPAPIQVNATINSGMMAITPVVQQPVPAASPMPSWFWQSTSGHAPQMQQLSTLEQILPMQKTKSIPVFLKESVPRMSSEDKMKLELMQLNEQIDNLKACSANEYLVAPADYSCAPTQYVNIGSEQPVDSISNQCILHTSVGSWDQGMLQVHHHHKPHPPQENGNQNQ